MAEFKYSMKDLSRIIDRTPARIYSYFKEDTDFYYSISNRKKDSKKGYLYNSAVLEKLKNRLLMENDLPTQDLFPTDDQTPITISPAIDEEKIALSAELEDLRGKYEALQANFDKANGEIVKMERENALKNEEIQRLLLIIQQEKQEKQQIMLMLPPPRKSIGERIRNLFRKKDEE